MTENSFSISGFKAGEWETVADRIKRRPFKRSDVIWHYEYSITRNYEGEEFTARCELPPEIIDDADIDTLNQILRNAFFGSMDDAVKRREGNWVTR